MLGSPHGAEAVAPNAGWGSLARWPCRVDQICIRSTPTWDSSVVPIPNLGKIPNWLLYLAVPWILLCIATPHVGVRGGRVFLLMTSRRGKEFTTHYSNHQPVRDKNRPLPQLAGMTQ